MPINAPEGEMYIEKPAAWQVLVRGKWCNLPEDWDSTENQSSQTYRPLFAAQEWQDISTAVEAERKACAKLAGDTALAWDNTLGGRLIGEEVSKAILARGTLFAEERGTEAKS